MNIHISREPVQTEKTAAVKENISEKQPVQNSEISEKAVKVNESAAEKQAEKQSVKSADITVTEKTAAHEHSNKTAENSSALNEKTKSLLGELHKNQDKLSESNKTADLSKNMTKTSAVSL